MPRKDISLLSERELALIVLSKLLYHIATKYPGMDSIVTHHRILLYDFLNQEVRKPNMATPEFSIYDIPWNNILDEIASKNTFIIEQTRTHLFTTHEIRYMCAMLCGLSGKEYGLITGFKSHYNLSWSIRHKLGLPSKTTNLRISLQKLSSEAYS